MASLFLWLTEWVMAIVAAMGYPGRFLLMLVGGILTPIPSEFIMPFAGSLAARGDLHVAFVIVVGTAGPAVGNFVAYHIGARVGRPFIARYGRYIALGEDDLAWAEGWFAKYGPLGVLVGHAVPGIRSFISFPAGGPASRGRGAGSRSMAPSACWSATRSPGSAPSSRSPRGSDGCESGTSLRSRPRAPRYGTRSSSSRATPAGAGGERRARALRTKAA